MMLSLDLSLSFSTALNPSFSNPKWPPNKKLRKLFSVSKKITYFHSPITSLHNQNTNHLQLSFPSKNPDSHRHILPPPSAGRSKKLPSKGRIMGNADVRREAKRKARRKSRKLAESLFYRLKNPHKNHADNFSEDELNMIGLGYDRMVRFMSRDDPNLKHPYDWFKYGEFGPYSWRGVVVGDPIRGRMSDECSHLIGSVRDHEEWDEIEQHDMAIDFGNRLNSLSKDIGLQNYWVFVRHPKWRLSELPWEQWTLVSEVVLEAGNQRLDKWSLMARLGNKTRELITKCAAWFRPDIIYVKKPVYQCRFEPQANFFKPLLPLLDPETEGDYMFELRDDEGRVELCTYFGGLCRIARVSPKVFVDDVVNAYEKLSDEKKSKCLEFLLTNHPTRLLHPYTMEWKAKLEEIELGCDAPDDGDDGGNFRSVQGEKEFVDWVEGEEDGNDDDEEDDYVLDNDEIVMDSNEEEDDDELDTDEEEDDEELDADEESELDEEDPEEDESYWKEELKNAISSNDAMEKFVKRNVEKTNEFYEKQMKELEKKETIEMVANNDDDGDDDDDDDGDGDGDELALRGKKGKVDPGGWKVVGVGRWRKKIKTGRIPPELFLRAAVRPFTYRNLVKEIVLMRHAILDGDISQDK